MLIDFLVNSPESGRDLRHEPRSARFSDSPRRRRARRLSQKIADYEASIADRLGDSPPVPIVGYGSLHEKFRQLVDEIDFGTLTVDEAVAQFFGEMDVVLAQ